MTNNSEEFWESVMKTVRYDPVDAAQRYQLAVDPPPGPWRNNGGQIEGPGGYPNVVARVGTVNEQTFQDTANARLIAAAPELLDMLELLLSITEEFKGAMAGKQRLMWDEVSARTADIRDETDYTSKGG